MEEHRQQQRYLTVLGTIRRDLVEGAVIVPFRYLSTINIFGLSQRSRTTGLFLLIQLSDGYLIEKEAKCAITISLFFAQDEFFKN